MKMGERQYGIETELENNTVIITIKHTHIHLYQMYNGSRRKMWYDFWFSLHFAPAFNGTTNAL